MFEKTMNYYKRIQQQIDQYKQTQNIHDLPPIFHYWSDKYLKPRLNKIMDVETVTDFYAQNLIQSMSPVKNMHRFLSIGSGDCSCEIDIVKNIISKTTQKFKFVCTDISPILLEKGRSKIQNDGLQDYFELLEIDINHNFPESHYDGVIANWVLHHLIKLEYIFDKIHESIRPNGVFLSFDAIGRNGHMRWPEALNIINCIWLLLPEEKKYNYQLNRLEKKFDNWDCSKEGFEGIRAQDILSNLVKRFHFSKFLAYGNIIDIFIDRAFGPNYLPNSNFDLSIIDFIENLNEELIDRNIIKPTMMCSVMQVNTDNHKYYKDWSPEFCIRKP